MSKKIYEYLRTARDIARLLEKDVEMSACCPAVIEIAKMIQKEEHFYKTFIPEKGVKQ